MNYYKTQIRPVVRAEFDDRLPEPPIPYPEFKKPKKKGWLVAELIFCITLFIILLTRLFWLLQTKGGRP